MTVLEGSQALLDRFLALHPRKIDLSLGRIEALLAKLGSPEQSLPPVIHVAGTNGKGSVIAFMRAILEAAGKSVHVYTSPHLINFHERIRLGGAPGAATGGCFVDEAVLVKTLAECERVNAGAPITVFEIATAAALKLFAGHPADFLLLETGLGGRYDATNVVSQPAACVIMPVSLDHAEFLGTDLKEIAWEKAGILKSGSPGVISWQQDVAIAAIEAEAARLRAPLLIAGQDFNCYEQNGRFIYEDGSGLLDLSQPGLTGQHQLENAGVAIATIRQLLPDLPDALIERGLQTVRWPARLQRLPAGPLSALALPGSEIWLDGGHNEAGGRVLAEAMADLNERAPRPLIVICGTLASKDTAGFLRHFRGLAREVIAVPIKGEHASRPAQEVADIARDELLAASAQTSVEDALSAIAGRDWPVPPRILIAGSLYLAGDVLRSNNTAVD